MNIVQGDVNTVYSHLATLVHSKPARESFVPFRRTPGVTRFYVESFRKDSRDKRVNEDGMG